MKKLIVVEPGAENWYKIRRSTLGNLRRRTEKYLLNGGGSRRFWKTPGTWEKYLASCLFRGVITFCSRRGITGLLAYP